MCLSPVTPHVCATAVITGVVAVGDGTAAGTDQSSEVDDNDETSMETDDISWEGEKVGDDMKKYPMARAAMGVRARGHRGDFGLFLSVLSQRLRC